MKSWLVSFVFLLFLISWISVLANEEQANAPLWISNNAQGESAIHLYFFWSKKCPHCLEARPFVQQLESKYSWLILEDKELTEYPQHIAEYIAMAKTFGKEPRSVPAFFWCGQMMIGFDDAEHMGAYLEEQLQHCHSENNKPKVIGALPSESPMISLPVIGKVSADQYSLPVYTLLLASLDAFNPCAFFVLFFLLSLLTHAKNRRRMLLIGGTFVVISGMLYFLFMAAWLNVFLLIGQINLITMIAGFVAVIIATINIKDYFWFKQGVSLSIPDQAKPGLFQRMRKLANADNLHTMMFATIGLAVFANTYELLCTAGFPLVYTRILTLNELSSLDYYLYLAFYNLIYVIPLLVIVLIFVKTLGSHKLQEKHGRQLKLISGMMMLSLGLVLLLAPQLLNNASIAILMFSIALLISALIIKFKAKATTDQQ